MGMLERREMDTIESYLESTEWLYTFGRAKRIAYIDSKGGIAVFEEPSEIRFFYGICRIFSQSTLDEIDFDWLVSGGRTVNAKFSRDGRARIELS